MSDIRVGDLITFSNFPTYRRRWWQFWKRREWSVNGTYRVTSSRTAAQDGEEAMTESPQPKG